ncbi:MAG: hypothetical protein V1684_02070 [bacterium]
MDFSKLLSLQYWFTMRVGALSDEARMWLVIIFGASLVLAVASFFLFKKYSSPLNNLFRRIFIFFITNAAIGAIWGFFREEAIPMLGSRFWLLFLLIADLIWLFYLIKYAVKQLPQEKKNQVEKKQFAKYLPKK